MELQSESESLRTKRTDAIVSVQRLENQKELMFQFKSKGREENLMFQLKGSETKVPSELQENQHFCSIQIFN